MKPTTPLARALLPLFQAVAVETGLALPLPIKVSVSKRCPVPEMRAGTVYIPAILTTMLDEDTASAICFVRTFVHELQHAVDFFDEASADRTREEWEARARQAERKLTNAQVEAILVRTRPALL